VLCWDAIYSVASLQTPQQTIQNSHEYDLQVDTSHNDNCVRRTERRYRPILSRFAFFVMPFYTNVCHRRKTHITIGLRVLVLQVVLSVIMTTFVCKVEGERKGVPWVPKMNFHPKQDRHFRTAQAHDRRLRLRSANRHQLIVPRCRLNTYGRRAFSVAGPTVWNSWPRELELGRYRFFKSVSVFVFGRFFQKSVSVSVSVFQNIAISVSVVGFSARTYHCLSNNTIAETLRPPLSPEWGLGPRICITNCGHKR